MTDREYRVSDISIHALREEGDPTVSAHLILTLYFYPRPPRGGRQNENKRHSRKEEFLSTPSARRATTGSWWRILCKIISIHALREEGDGVAC